MAGEDRTKALFGDYVSIYNFRQSVEDSANRPLYCENRILEQLCRASAKRLSDNLISFISKML